MDVIYNVSWLFSSIRDHGSSMLRGVVTQAVSEGSEAWECNKAGHVTLIVDAIFQSVLMILQPCNQR